MNKAIYSNLSNITQKWVDLLIPLTGDYTIRLSASELARQAGIPQQTGARHLDNLAGAGLIEYERQGRNKLFYLDLKKQTGKIIINIAENQKALYLISFAKINAILNEILRECESMLVFGSYASLRFDKESDLDLIIFNCRNKNKIKKIKDLHPLEINEHYSTYAEFKKVLSSRNALALEVAKNHVIFGNVSMLVEILTEAKSS